MSGLLHNPTRVSAGAPFRLSRLNFGMGHCLCASFGLASVLAFSPALVAQVSTPTPPPAFASRSGWPLFFEPGPSGRSSPTNFLARGPNFQMVLSPVEADFVLRQPEPGPAPDPARREQALRASRAAARAVRISLVNANPRAAISGGDLMTGKVNYLIGNDPAQWRTQVPMFGQVRIQDLYPGIDLLYYGNHRQLEYDFTLSPGADPARIALRFQGVDRLSVSSAGELLVRVGQAELRQHPPVVYQFVKGRRRDVAGRYQIQDARTVSFALGAYDRALPLIIDPVFSYSTFVGGNGGDTGLAVKVDAGGSVYLAGETLSTQFPWGVVGAPFQSQFKGGGITGDAFVAKFDNTGAHLLYFTYLGGSSDDGAYDLAIDSAGNAFLTGFTVSPDFPTARALYPQISGSQDSTFHVFPSDAFVAELNTNGSGLVYSTYLGGTDRDVGSAIAVDPAGYAYVAGYTFSTNFPAVNAQERFLIGNDDAFVAKIAPGGGSLVYSTYLGGNGIDEAQSIAADPDGFAYVAGYTSSINFPVTPDAYQTNLNGNGIAITVFDAFLTKIGPLGGTLEYSTYFGGEQNDYGYRLALDSSRNVYLTGTTQSTNFPHANLFNLPLGEDGTNIINFDAFLTKFDTNGIPAYSAQFGGTFDDAGWDVAVDPLGRAFVVGITASTNFPVRNPFDLLRSFNAGFNDVFVVAFDTNAAPVLYSGYLGGGANDYGYAIAVDAEANAYVSGMTFSTNFPTTAGAFASSLNGTSDAFVAKIRWQNPVLSVVILDGAIQVTWPATAPDYALQSTTDLSPPQTWTNVPQPPVLTNGLYRVTLPTTGATTLFRLHRL